MRPLVLLLTLLVGPMTSLQAATVVTTIKPLQLLASAINDGVGDVELLLPPNSSPHDYQLRPSDLKKLERADVIFWIGPQLERFIEKSLLQRSDSTEIVGLLEALQPGLSPTESATHHENHDHGHDHHAAIDPHIWLSPQLGTAMAEKMTEVLAARDPDNAERYRQNLAQFRRKMTRFDQTSRQQFQPLLERGYYVFHDAYGHFEQHYGLNNLGAFTIDPARRPGARHLNQIRQSLEQSRAVCIFSEPQFKPAILHVITEGLALNQGRLDPLATGVEPGPEGYLEFLQQLRQEFIDCLSPTNPSSGR